MRVDKWIWAVRMVKSRTLAGECCKRGQVWINQEKAKPAKTLHIGDIVEVEIKSVYKKYKVTGFIPKRVSAELAAQNFEDLTPKAEQTQTSSTEPQFWGQRKKGEGRPTKKDRRKIDEAKLLDEI